MDRIQKKRLLIFIAIPILLIFLVFFQSIWARAFIALLLLSYTGFIIFLRDSMRFVNEVDSIKQEDIISEVPSATPIEPDANESFEIVSKNKNIEIQSAFSPGRNISGQNLIPPDLKERFDEIVNEALPENIDQSGQFSFVLEKILIVIREVYQAHSALFFWFDKKKEKITLENFVSNSNNISKRKFDVEDDILSKIVQTGEPELLTDISPVAEVDVIRYYTAPETIRSFVGVPLFYNKMLIAIIAVDSKSNDNFGIETIYTLGRFVRVITMMISIFEEKHSENISQQRLKSLLSIISSENKFDTEEELINSIKNSVSTLIGFDAFAFVYFNPVDQKFRTIKVINNTSLKYVGESLEIDMNLSLVGKTIMTGMPIKIDDTSAENFVRFAKVEDVTFDGSFLTIPIIFNNQNYGVLCFESLKKYAYSNSDVHFMKNAMSLLGFIIYSYSSQKLLKSLMAIDVETRVLNNETFRERLNSDLAKANELKVQSAIALIKIDDFLEQESLFEGNPFPKVLQEISGIISSEINNFCTIGRLDEKLFGVYFFNSSSKDVFLWAEKLRVKIARKPISVVSKQTTYTVSIGVASAVGIMDIDELINNAGLALKKALERGGNKVMNLN